jgi:hypothetical protein
MAELPTDQASLVVAANQPLIGVILRENDRDVVRYFAEEGAADAALPSGTENEALQLSGAWRDLDWSDVQAALDRIRHDSPPSPPISL